MGRKETPMEKRFYYCRSHVYGWAVYDRQTNTPAWEACAQYLPPVRQDENGTVTVDPCCDSEYAAMRLCTKLSIAERKATRS